MNVDRALVFKSIDAKKQNPQNRPGKFTVKFFPELFLENNKQHFLALDHLSMTRVGIIFDQNMTTTNW